MSKLQEQLWKDPDWNCPQCGFVNRAIRSRCRNFQCGFEWEDSGGAFVINEAGIAEPWSGDEVSGKDSGSR